MRFLSVILATAGMTLLLIDSEVFTRFHLHLNPIVWQLVINPDENEMARLAADVHQRAGYFIA